jgi:hypothetical protein
MDTNDIKRLKRIRVLLQELLEEINQLEANACAVGNDENIKLDKEVKGKLADLVKGAKKI